MQRGDRRARVSLYDRFSHFWHSREPYVLRYDPVRLSLNLLYVVLFVLFTIFMYNLIDPLNAVTVFFLRLGSLLFVVCCYFLLRFSYLALRDLRKLYHNSKRGYQLVAVCVLVCLVWFGVTNQNTVVSTTVNFFSSFEYSSFMLFSISETLGSSSLVDPLASSSRSDMRSLVTFLPIPWGFTLLWMVLIAQIVLFVIVYLYHNHVHRFIIAFVILCLVIMFFAYKVPYVLVPAPGIGVCNTFGDLSFSFDAFVFRQPCGHYASSECRPLCSRAVPVCQCEAPLFDVFFVKRATPLP